MSFKPKHLMPDVDILFLYLLYLTVRGLIQPVAFNPLKCTVMLDVLCERDWCVVEMYPVWPMWSRDLAPSTLSTYPPPYLPGEVGTQFTGSLQEGWIWTVKWRFAASPTQILCFWIMYAILFFLHLESCFEVFIK